MIVVFVSPWDWISWLVLPCPHPNNPCLWSVCESVWDGVCENVLSLCINPLIWCFVFWSLLFSMLSGFVFWVWMCVCLCVMPPVRLHPICWYSLCAYCVVTCMCTWIHMYACLCVLVGYVRVDCSQTGSCRGTSSSQPVVVSKRSTLNKKHNVSRKLSPFSFVVCCVSSLKYS